MKASPSGAVVPDMGRRHVAHPAEYALALVLFACACCFIAGAKLNHAATRAGNSSASWFEGAKPAPVSAMITPMDFGGRMQTADVAFVYTADDCSVRAVSLPPVPVGALSYNSERNVMQVWDGKRYVDVLAE